MLGLTGPNASGKGEVCRFLADEGFTVHSLSDVIRDEARRRDLPPEREQLIQLGNELRAAGGPGVLARTIRARLEARSVVDSIRNPAEVEALRELPRFVLLGIHAPVELRFSRSVQRARAGDPAGIQQFKAREAEENTDNPAAQRLDATFSLADRTIDNDGDLPRLHARLRDLLCELDDASGSPEH